MLFGVHNTRNKMIYTLDVATLYATQHQISPGALNQRSGAL